MSGSGGDLTLDPELLIEEDEDLLGYFLGNENHGDLDIDLRGPIQIEEVNTGMEALLRNRPDSNEMTHLNHPDGSTGNSPLLPYGNMHYPQPSGQPGGGRGYVDPMGLTPPGAAVPHGVQESYVANPGPGGYWGAHHSMQYPQVLRSTPSSSSSSPAAAAAGSMGSPSSAVASAGVAGATAALGKAASEGARKARSRATGSTSTKTKAVSFKSTVVSPHGATTSPASSSSAVKSEAAVGGANGASGGKEDSEDKRQRRLARNRESARQSRRRKKEHLSELEDRVSRLAAELDELRRLHLEEANKALQMRRRKLLDDLAEKAAAGLHPVTVKDNILRIMEESGPGSKERLEMLDHHYKHLFNLLLPPYTKFMLWMMNQGESFFEDKPQDQGSGKRGETGLWGLVSNELGLSQEQQEKLRINYKQYDTSSRDERHRLSMCISFLAKLRSNITTRSKTVETQTRALLNILNPDQALKYLLWVEQNRTTLDECGIGESIIFDSPGRGGEASDGMNDPKYAAARDVLLKSDSETTLNDLRVLMDVLDGN